MNLAMMTMAMCCRRGCLKYPHAEQGGQNHTPRATEDKELCIRQSNLEFYREIDAGLLLNVR